MNSINKNQAWRRARQLGLAVLLAAGSALLVSGQISAEDGAKPKKGGVCKADVKKFCADIERGEGRIRQCLQENRASLAPACQERLQKREERRAAFDAACGADAKSLCGEKRGKELRSCMKANRDKVSTSCKEFVKNAREKRKAEKQ